MPVVLFRGALAEWTSRIMLFSGLVTELSLLGWQPTIQQPPFLEIRKDIYGVSKKLVLLKPLFVLKFILFLSCKHVNYSVTKASSFRH